MEGAGGVVLRALAKLGLTDQMRRLNIAAAWPQAVGPHIAARTAVHSFSRGVLHVRAASPAWQNELSYLKADLLAKLNARLEKPCVRELRVRCGDLAPTPVKPPASSAVQPPSASQKAHARQVSAPIADPSARQAFERMLLTALGRPPTGPPLG